MKIVLPFWDMRSHVSMGLKLPHKSDKVLLLRLGQFHSQDQIEKLDGIFKREASAVVQVGRTLLDAPQGERLDGAIAGFVKEALEMEVVHLMIEVERRLVTVSTFALAEENLFPTQFAFGGLGWIERSFRIQFGRGREIEHVL